MTQLIVAIDTADLEYAWYLMRVTKPYCAMFKIGSEFFTAHGQRGACYTDHPLFLDLKWHDIPTTVAKSVKAALPMRPAMITVHAAGGAEMVRAARDAAETAGDKRPLVIAVTRLTSLSPNNPETTGLAYLAMSNGADGLVCSPHEITLLRWTLGDDLKLVVPGIRPAGTPTDDQARTATPEEARAAGADYIVVGRPITAAKDPGAATKAIAESIR